jgi:hypothetical protein
MTHHKPIPLRSRVMLHTERVICVVSFMLFLVVPAAKRKRTALTS